MKKATYTTEQLKAIVNKAEKFSADENGKWGVAFQNYSEDDYQLYLAAKRQLKKIGEYVA